MRRRQVEEYRRGAVDLHSGVVPRWHYLAGAGLRLDVEFGRDVVVHGAVEQDHDFGLELVGGSGGRGFDEGFALRICARNVAAQFCG